MDFDLLKSVERNVYVSTCKQLSPESSEPLSSHEIAVPKNPKRYQKIPKGSKRQHNTQQLKNLIASNDILYKNQRIREVPTELAGVPKNFRVAKVSYQDKHKENTLDLDEQASLRNLMN